MRKYSRLNEEELHGAKLFDMIDDCLDNLADTYVARMYSDDDNITIAVPQVLRQKYSAEIDETMKQLGYKFYTSGLNDDHIMLSYRNSTDESMESNGMYKVGMCIRINHLKGEDDRYDGREGRIEMIDDIGQLHGTWGGLAVIPEEDDVEIIDCEMNEEMSSAEMRDVFADYDVDKCVATMCDGDKLEFVRGPKGVWGHYDSHNKFVKDDNIISLINRKKMASVKAVNESLNEDENDAKRNDIMVDVHLDNANESMQYVIAYINTTFRKGVERNNMDEVKENLTAAWKHCKTALDEISDAIDARKLHKIK